MEIKRLSGHAGLGEPGGAMRGCGESLVALAADAAFGHNKCFAINDAVFNGLTGIRIYNHGSRRHFDDQVVAFFPGPVVALAVAAVFGFKNFFIAELIQGSSSGSGEDNDIPAFTAVSAVRTAFGNKLFSAKTYAAPAAVSGFDKNGYFINKFQAE